MSPQPNPSLSVDCVVFGFDGAALKVLLVERDFVNPAGERIHDFKLPGSLIFQDEELRASAARVLDKYMADGIFTCANCMYFHSPTAWWVKSCGGSTNITAYIRGGS